ncbi:DNA-binding response regulator [Hallella multisaccharivorax DSM 17128]|uniref:Two component transcriptional regulator, LytTR family n=1 Tax=Hallella multisaccharivorax DSM 17128 TaxID=688246 RepID=F8N5T7_9BACT|nr:LytTR family DNA-binding domain-containing protein [Hallella multisaccharivorax]EGN56099.1 two component transcriptional regulator, LytTR family [Hallella multisaccharivorax DSM 17128]GJG29594.1 DNA-binding response regulator [Hallella multisaccharivorax DSM 17128]
MYKTLIIEDEPLGAEHLRKLILDIDDTISVSGPLKSVEEVKEALRCDNNYDLIFSDIRLGGNIVFDAFKEIFPNALIIFTTAYDEYAIRAFRNNGIDYLLKPIVPDELKAAIDKVRKLTLRSETQKQGLENLVNTSEHKTHHHLLIPKGDELIPINTDDISYICKKFEVRAYLFDGQGFAIPFTLGELEDMLDPEIFFRINRQYIANRRSFKRISIFLNSKLIVRLKGCNDDNIIISKERTIELKRWLSK